MRILLAEDERLTRRSIQRELERSGHDVRAVEDGAAAWDEFRSGQFDMVVTDWDMPRMDGRELVERIRTDDRASYAYVIMLTGRSETQDIVAGMEAGADDFLAKPWDRDELRVRLSAGERIITLERRLAEQNVELRGANARMKNDLLAAAKVQQSLLPSALPDSKRVRFEWAYKPCDELAGDSLGLFRFDERHVGMYVLDVTGHGVAAALLSVAVTHSLSQRDPERSIVTRQAGDGDERSIVGPAEVAGHLNQQFPMADSDNRFFTMIYAVLDTHEGRLHYAAAGHPGPLVLRADGTTEAHDSTGLPIGIDDGATYEERVIDLATGDRFYLYSDGAIEEMNHRRELFGFEQFRSVLVDGRDAPLAATLESAIAAISAWAGREGFSDDVSLVAAETVETKPG